MKPTEPAPVEPIRKPKSAARQAADAFDRFRAMRTALDAKIAAQVAAMPDDVRAAFEALSKVDAT
jgi:hypothetical protein